MRSLVLLAAEAQVTDSLVVVLAVGEGVYHGVLDIAQTAALLREKYASLAPSAEVVREIERIAAMTAEERAAFWTARFARCTRCYACRAACPLCYCTRCIVEKNVPQWISSAGYRVVAPVRDEDAVRLQVWSPGSPGRRRGKPGAAIDPATAPSSPSNNSAPWKRRICNRRRRRAPKWRLPACVPGSPTVYISDCQCEPCGRRGGAGLRHRDGSLRGTRCIPPRTPAPQAPPACPRRGPERTAGG